jgi:hypothetical protein
MIKHLQTEMPGISLFAQPRGNFLQNLQALEVGEDD